MPYSVPRAYLDACLVSGLAKQDLGVEQESLHDLLRLGKAGRVGLVTSELAKDELTDYEGQLPQHEAIYNLLLDVPRVRESDAGNLLLLGVGGGEDEVFTDLKRTLPDIADARHVFTAIKNEVDYFVTTDARTILRYASALAQQHGLRALRPSAVVAELA